MEILKLNNDIEIPILGFGVYQIPKDICEKCVLDAIEVGYRLIDTAQAYHNEEEVGHAIVKCGVPRSELFITTKVWLSNYGYDETIKSVEESMAKLQVDYLDLILLHQPFGDYYSSYRALEDLYKRGLVRSIGISNFYPDRVTDLCLFNEVIPQVNQIEINPFYQQIEAQSNMEKYNVQTQAWAPFGEGRNNMFSNPILLEIAKSHGKSVAQVILRWLIQRNIVTLAKSSHKERMAENFAIFDFKLTNIEMTIITDMDTENSLFFHHQTPEAVEKFHSFLE